MPEYQAGDLKAAPNRNVGRRFAALAASWVAERLREVTVSIVITKVSPSGIECSIRAIVRSVGPTPDRPETAKSVSRFPASERNVYEND